MNKIALRYAELGFRVIPFHGIKDGSCTCGDHGCEQPGRHPRSQGGLRDATSDLRTVRQMWAKWPKARIGIALGGDVSKFLALVTENEAARRSLQKMIAVHGGFPTTVTIQDGDRYISLLRGDGRARCNDLLAEGIRISGEGDFIIAPSRFASRGRPRFVPSLSIKEVEIAQAPEWLLELCATAPKVAVSADPVLAAAKTWISPVDFLQELLRRSPMPARDAKRLGREAGYSEKSLRTARAKLKVTSNRTGGIGGLGKWVWALPGAAPNPVVPV